MNRCDECKHWGATSAGYGQCRKQRLTTAFWWRCDQFKAPAPDVVDAPEPEEEPKSVLLEKYRVEGKA